HDRPWRDIRDGPFAIEPLSPGSGRRNLPVDAEHGADLSPLPPDDRPAGCRTEGEPVERAMATDGDLGRHRRARPRRFNLESVGPPSVHIYAVLGSSREA